MRSFAESMSNVAEYMLVVALLVVKLYVLRLTPKPDQVTPSVHEPKDVTVQVALTISLKKRFVAVAMQPTGLKSAWITPASMPTLRPASGPAASHCALLMMKVRLATSWQ